MPACELNSFIVWLALPELIIDTETFDNSDIDCFLIRNMSDTNIVSFGTDLLQGGEGGFKFFMHIALEGNVPIFNIFSMNN